MTIAAYITSIIGKDSGRLSITTSAVIAFISFFYIYTIGSYLKVVIYPLENRVIYDIFFDIYIINKQTDHIIIAAGIVLWLVLSLKGKAKYIAPLLYGGVAIIAALHPDAILDMVALSSIPIVISFFLYNRFASKKKNKQILNTHANSLLVNYLAIIGIITGIVGVIISLTPLFAVTTNSMLVRNYPYEIFLLFSSFSPALILLLISCLPVKLILNEFMSGILIFKNNYKGTLLSSNSTNIKSGYIFICLLLSMLMSVAVALIPHQPTINKDNQQIGVDTDYYVKWVNMLMHSRDYQEFLRQTFVSQSLGDRPLTLILLFTIAKIINLNLFYITEHLPVILGPALVLAVFFLTRELTSNDTTSLFSSFLTAISFQVLIGIYAGFYANWFALIIGYTSFVFLTKFLKKPCNKLNLVLFSALLIFLLFSHTYTWSILVIVMSLFLAVMLIFNYYHRKAIILLLLVVLASIIIDVARMTITGSASGVEKDIEIAKITGAGPQQFALRWINLMRTTYSFVGGQFSNFIIFTLALYWLFWSNFREPSTIFLIIFVSTGLLPFLIGDYIIQTRVFYDIPFQIPAAIGLAFIRKQDIGSIIVVLPICLWLLDVAIMAVSNFYLVHSS